MAMEKQKELVVRLLRRSKLGELDWVDSADGDGFVVSFRDNSVRIRSVLRPETLDYEISLLNDEGREVEVFTDPELKGDAPGSSWFSIMKELYEIARRSALGADKLLDEILDELDGDPKQA